jgi:hypothetical protein
MNNYMCFDAENEITVPSTNFGIAILFGQGLISFGANKIPLSVCTISTCDLNVMRKMHSASLMLATQSYYQRTGIPMQAAARIHEAVDLDNWSIQAITSVKQLISQYFVQIPLRTSMWYAWADYTFLNNLNGAGLKLPFATMRLPDWGDSRCCSLVYSIKRSMPILDDPATSNAYSQYDYTVSAYLLNIPTDSDRDTTFALTMSILPMIRMRDSRGGSAYAVTWGGDYAEQNLLAALVQAGAADVAVIAGQSVPRPIPYSLDRTHSPYFPQPLPTAVKTSEAPSLYRNPVVLAQEPFDIQANPTAPQMAVPKSDFQIGGL